MKRREVEQSCGTQDAAKPGRPQEEEEEGTTAVSQCRAIECTHRHLQLQSLHVSDLNKPPG